MKTHTIYILLTNTGSVLTKLIKLYTKKPYNHASIALDSHLSEVYSFGRKNVNNPFHGGFVKEDITKGLFTQADCAIYSLTVSKEEMHKVREYMEELADKEECYRYNFLGLFGFLVNKPIKRKNALFCSEFVATVINKCTNLKFQKPTSLIAPSDFQDMAHFQLMYEG